MNQGRRRHGVLAPLLGLALAASGACLADQPAAPATGLAGADALAPFFGELADLKAGRRANPVQILQIGDSHTAADLIASAVRVRLQAKFGEAGRGVLPPGVPFVSYGPRQVDVTQSDGWKVESSFPVPGPGFGLSGWRLTSTRPGATVTMTADPEAKFDEAVICAMTGPGAGSIDVDAGDDHEVVPLAAATVAPRCRTFGFSAPQSRLQIASDGASVTLLSFATFRSRPGISLSNLGVVGTELQDFAKRDDAIVGAELQAYAPDLIVMAFGTNEGFAPNLDLAAYETLVHDQIRRLKRLAPHAAILLLGPPDASLVRPDIPEDGIHNLNFACAPLSPDEIANYGRLVADKAPALARWYEPPTLRLVREAQRRAAAAEGAAFWDWDARMGGACSSHRLSRPEVKLMRGDHVHFTSDGGELIGGLLTDDLMSAYAARRPGG